MEFAIYNFCGSSCIHCLQITLEFGSVEMFFVEGAKIENLAQRSPQSMKENQQQIQSTFSIILKLYSPR